MNKIIRNSLIAAGMLTASSAMAQSNVTVYGIIDTGVSYVTNSYNAARTEKGPTAKVMTLTGTLPSRIGFKGSEDLGNGLSAIFTLESGFSPDTGAEGQGNRIFGRQAFVGLSGDWGQLTIGRINNMTTLSMMKSDVLGPNVFAMGSVDAYLANGRSDNAIGYMGRFGGLSVGATYSFGRDSSSAGGPAATNCGGETQGDSKACRQITALLGYDSSAFGITASYDTMNGGNAAAAPLNSPKNKDTRAIVSGYVMLSKTKFGAGYIDRRVKIEGADDLHNRMIFAGISHPFTDALTFDVQVSQMKERPTDGQSILSVARVVYGLSKRTAIYATGGHINNNNNSRNPMDAGGFAHYGTNQSGFAMGLRHFF